MVWCLKIVNGDWFFMYFASYDKVKNHIHIIIKGTMNEIESKRYSCDIKDLIDSAREGFTVCADISKADKTVLENKDAFQFIRDYAKSKGMKESVTVISITNSDYYKKSNNLFYCLKDAYHYLYSVWRDLK